MNNKPLPYLLLCFFLSSISGDVFSLPGPKEDNSVATQGEAVPPNTQGEAVPSNTQGETKQEIAPAPTKKPAFFDEIRFLDENYLPTNFPRLNVSPKSHTTQIFLPSPMKEEWLSPRNVPAFIAILISICTFFYTVWSQIRSRRISVNDEFWFRKVTYPLIVEPITGFFTTVVTNLPSDGRERTESDFEKIKEYNEEFQKDIERHRNCLTMLVATFDAKVARQTYDDMSCALDDLEDIVTSYCYTVSATEKNLSDSSLDDNISKQQAIIKIQESLTKFIKPVRAWQHKN